MMDGTADIDLSMMTLKSEKKKDEMFTIVVAESVTTWYSVRRILKYWSVLFSAIWWKEVFFFRL